jgi:hypothetical protein
MNKHDTQRRGIEFSSAKVAEKGGKFISAEVPPALLPLLCSPFKKLV